MSEALFLSAVQHIKNSPNEQDPDLKNRLYGLYKQATEGDCSQEAPSRTNASARAKWEAWNNVRGLSRQEAMENYVALVRTVDKAWVPQTTAASAAVAGRKQGVLYKQRDVFKGWRPRVFVLDETMAALHYYFKEDDIQTGQPRKSILLTGCAITEVRPTRNGDVEFYPFVVSHPQSSKTYNLASDNRADAEGWIRALKEAAARPPPSMTASQVDPAARLLPRHMPKDTASSGLENKNDDVDRAGRPRVPPEFASKIDTAISTLLECGATLDEWQPAFQKGGVQAFRRPGALVCVRGDGEIPHSMSDVFTAIIDLDRKKEWDSQLASAKRLKKFSANTWVDHLKFKPVWPTSARDMVNLCHWRLLDDGTLVLVAFSHKFDELAPREEGIVRAECIIAGYILRPLNGGRAVKVTYIVQTDLKGTIPTTVVNMVAEGQPMLVGSLRKMLDGDAQSQTRPRMILPTRNKLTTADVEYIFENHNDPTKLTAAPHAEAAAPAAAASTGKGEAASAARKPDTAVSTAVPAEDTQAGAAPRRVGMANLCVLFLPVILYYLPNPKYRGLAFVAGCLFAFRYIFKLHMGSPRIQPGSLATEQIADGRMLVRFNVEIGRLLRYLEEKRKSTEVEITLTHVTIKAAALALLEYSNINGRVVLGAFYPSNDIDVSVSLSNSDNNNAVIKVTQAHRKPVDYLANEVENRTKALSDPNNPEVRRKLAIRDFFHSMPPAMGNAAERALHILGAHLGVSLPALGVQPFPLGSCTIVTAPPPSTENDASLDVDMTVIPAKFNASTPITLTIGGVHMQPKVDNDGRMTASHVLGVTATIDCRAATLPQGRMFCEKVQELLNTPQLLDKFDRQQMLAIERELNTKDK